MPEHLPAEVEELVRRADAFASAVLQPLERTLETSGQPLAQARSQVVAAATEAGLFRLSQPVEVGGLGAGPLTLVAVRETIASHNPVRLTDVFGPRPGVLTGVGEPLCSSHLAPMLAGRRQGGFAITEPREATAYTRAVRDRDELVVTGRKSYVTAGAHADFVNVVADIADEGRAVVVVDADTAGVSVERVFQTLDGSEHAAFRFDAVRVPASHLVGTPGDGMKRALRQIGDTRLLVAAEAVGLARWVMAELTAHIRRGEANGHVRESARLRYGELRIKVYAARSALYRAARRAESEDNSVNEEIAAKVFATETLGEVVDQAIQLWGGGALTMDHPLAVLYRKARVLRVAEGLTDVLNLGVARGAIELDKGTL